MRRIISLVEYEARKAEIVVGLLTRYVARSLRGQRILEMGCSTGVLMRLLEEQGATALGVDVRSPWSGQYMYKPENRQFLDLQDEDLRSEWGTVPFDLVVAQEVVEHLDRPYDFLRRVWRVLTPGGHLFLTTPNLLGITAFLKGERWCGLATEGHRLLYSAKSLDFIVGNCGFRRVRTFTNFVPIYHQAKHPWLMWVNGALRWTGVGGGLMGFYQKVELPTAPEQQTL